MSPPLPELVAPAGSPAALQAALEHGADAVYLGLRHLSARAHATNFSLRQLAVATQQARDQGCKVLVTLNTLLRADELPTALRLLRWCQDCGVHAIVVQDLGLARLAQRRCPGLRLHASTQLAVHDLGGARQAASLGFRRAVLARELDLAEIRHIRRELPELELEVFVHGSLCFSASGLCLASALAEGRRRGRSAQGRSAAGQPLHPGWSQASAESFSGNRGRCLQPCRRPFHDPNGEPQGLPFSLRDLVGLDLVPALVEAGVHALKIEGRLRSPAWVGAAVHAYRGALACATRQAPPPGWERAEAERAVRTLFSRRASSGYLLEPGQDPPAGAALVQVQPAVQGHLGVRVGRVLQVSASHLLVSVERAFERGDRLLVACTEGRLGHLDLAWLADPGGQPVSTARPGSRLRLPLPARRVVAAGAELRLAHSPSITRRFQPRPQRAASPPPDAPAVRLQAKADAGSLWLRASCHGAQVERSYPLGPEPVDGLQAAQIRALLRRREGTSTLGEVRCQVRLDSPLRTPPKALRRVRRDILRRLELALELTQLDARYPDAPEQTPLPGQDGPEERWILRSDRPQLLALGLPLGFTALELVLDPADPRRLQRSCELIPADSLRCVLPPVLRGADAERMGHQLQQARALGIRSWVLSNLSHAALLAEAPHEARIADDLLYACNPWAAASLQEQLGVQELQLPLELDRPTLKAQLSVLGARATVVLYSDVAVFRSALPPQGPYGPVPDTVLDELEHPYHRARQGSLSVLVDGRPLCLAPHLDALRAAGARGFRVDLCWRPYLQEEVRGLTAALRAGQAPPGSHDGNWRRSWL